MLAALAAFLFSRRLIGSIDNLAQTMDLLAEGRTDMVVGHRERRDEIGAMARAVETIRESKAKVDRMIEDDRLSLEGGSSGWSGATAASLASSRR